MQLRNKKQNSTLHIKSRGNIIKASSRIPHGWIKCERKLRLQPVLHCLRPIKASHQEKKERPRQLTYYTSQHGEKKEHTLDESGSRQRDQDSILGRLRRRLRNSCGRLLQQHGRLDLITDDHDGLPTHKASSTTERKQAKSFFI